MKKVIVMLAVLAVTANVFAAITGSAHDFRDAVGEDIAGNTKFCEPCHVPHVAANTVGAPLWNHAVSVEVFTPYVSPGAPLDGAITVPASTSLLCLSCHDGVTNMDAFGGAVGTTAMTGGNAANLGTDLTTSHPVSITYTTATASADGSLFDPSSASSGVGPGTVDEDILIDGKVECSSCHDVHDKLSLTGMLVKSNAVSALCMTCHDK